MVLTANVENYTLRINFNLCFYFCNITLRFAKKPIKICKVTFCFLLFRNNLNNELYK